MHIRVSWALILAAALAGGGSSFAQTNLTAFSLVRQGALTISHLPKNALIQIESAKSVDKLAPSTWYIQFHDPSVAFKTTELKYVAGQLMDTTHPKCPVQLFLGVRSVSGQLMKVDSDRALAIALGLPELKNIPIRADQMWFESRPTDAWWRIRLWMTRADDPAKMRRLGDVYVSAKDGAIVKNKLNHKLLTAAVYSPQN